MPKLIQLLEEKCTLKQVDEPLQQTTMGEDYLVRGYEGCFLSIKEFHMTIFRMLNKNTVDTTSSNNQGPPPSANRKEASSPVNRCNPRPLPQAASSLAPSFVAQRRPPLPPRDRRLQPAATLAAIILYSSSQISNQTLRSAPIVIRIKRPPLLFPRLISTEYIGQRRSPLPLPLCGSRPLLSGRASVEADLRGGSSDSSRLSALGDDKNMFAPLAAAATATTAPFHLRR
ncbi:hypothetical protein BHE74_00003652 [Ensete ventricosum]|nr:hypothetical protein BHE74_00003652 [Ensete ventricosum]RZR76383.1 hypothetical protein BHM03_00001117 [Ensete ventricosum]